MSSAITHIGFADESSWNTGRFRSLGLVTLPTDCLEMLSDEARGLLDESNVREFKWKELSGAKERLAAEKLCGFAVNQACARHLRVDVLVWDIEDTRHRIARRDDIANLERMYYHLFRNVLRKRWPRDSIWRLCPDEHSALDWKVLQYCLNHASSKVELGPRLVSDGQLGFQSRQEFGLEEVKPLSSEAHPLLQIADLFAGLAVFSREKFDEYEQWLKDMSPQAAFWDEADASRNPSHSSKQRFPLLKKFDELCKERKLGVSLRSRRGLRTLKPQNPVNFWLYEPQCQDDTAPQKGRL